MNEMMSPLACSHYHHQKHHQDVQQNSFFVKLKLSSAQRLNTEHNDITTLTVLCVALPLPPGLRAVHVAVLGAGELVTQDDHNHLLPQHGARQPSQPEVDVVLDDL